MNTKWLLLALFFILIIDALAGFYYLSYERLEITSNPIPQEIVVRAKGYTWDKMKVFLNTYLILFVFLFVLNYFAPHHTYANFSIKGFVIAGCIVVAGGYLLSLPSRYLSYKIDVRYGISLLTTKKWLVDRLKEFLLLEIFSAILFAIVGLFRERLVLLLGVSFVFLLLLNFLTPFVVNLFVKGEKVDGDRISELLRDMGRRHGIVINGYYILKTEERSRNLNAMVAGIGPTLRVMIYDRLLKEFSPDEIFSVVAHEFYHWKAKHILKGFLLSFAMFSIFMLFILKIYPPNEWTGGLSHIKIVSSIILFAMTFSLLTLPFTNTVSRTMEKNADVFAVKEAGVEPFVNAEIKLVESNLIDPIPNPLFEFFFYDHPSAIKRINISLKERR